MEGKKRFRVEYRETQSHAIDVLADNEEQAKELAEECFDSFGFEHRAVTRFDNVDTKLVGVTSVPNEDGNVYSEGDDEL